MPKKGNWLFRVLGTKGGIEWTLSTPQLGKSKAYPDSLETGAFSFQPNGSILLFIV